MPITITNETMYGKEAAAPGGSHPATLERPEPRIQISRPEPQVDPFAPAIEAVVNSRDSFSKEKALADLTTQYGDFEGQKLQQLKSTAYAKLGVGNLERQLRFMEQKDRSHPMWNQFQTDSTETAAARAAYDRSLGLAENYTRELVTTDPDLVRVKARLGGFVKMHERLLSNMLQKEGIQSEKVDQITSILTTDNLAAVQAIYPDVKDPQEIKLRAAQLITNPKFNQEASVIMDPSAKPKDFLTAAVHGVSLAEPYVIQQQSILSGQSPLEVGNELTKMKALVNNPTALQAEADKFLSPIEKQELGNLQQKAILAKDKESLARLQALKVSIAVDIIRAVKKDTLLGNAESWQPVDGVKLTDLPEFSSIKAAKKPINLDVIYREFVYKAPKEARSQRAALVQQHLFANAHKLNGTLYGNIVDLSVLKAKAQAMAIPGLFDIMASSLDTRLSNVTAQDVEATANPFLPL